MLGANRCTGEKAGPYVYRVCLVATAQPLLVHDPGHLRDVRSYVLDVSCNGDYGKEGVGKMEIGALKGDIQVPERSAELHYSNLTRINIGDILLGGHYSNLIS